MLIIKKSERGTVQLSIGKELALKRRVLINES